MNHCECNMNCDPHLTARIKHVYGNVLRLAIPLTLRSLMKDGDTIVATDSDFIPSSDYPVNVVFGKGNKNIAIPAEMDGNVAIIEEKGKMPVGTYDITVECRDDLGQPYRFKKDTVLQVVDVTAEAGIEPTIEYEAQTWYLDAAIFLATTEIGSMSEEIERRLEDVFGDVDYDAENKVIKFYDKNKTHVLGTIDSRPFIVDGTVDDVYIDVSRQVLVVILNEDAGGRRFSVPLYLVFDNYYKKDEVDSKVDHKADVLGDGRLPGAEATPVVLDYIYAPPSGSPIIPINPQAGEVIYFANEHKIRRYYYEDAGQSGGFPAIVYVEETPSRYVVYYNKRDEKFYRYDAGSLSMVEIETVGGGGEGTVTGVKVGDTTYEPTNGVVDISAGIPDVSGFVTASDVADAVADLVDSAPATLDTLKELADALGDDPNFATTMTTSLGNKVDKVTGKGLSTEDYTTAEKSKLEGLSNYDDTALQAAVAGKVDKETGKSLMTDAERTKLQGIAACAEVNVQPNWTQTNTSADDYIKNKPTLATVATSGSYNDLSNKPTIPTVDSTPTQNSTNAVQSGAVYTALAGKQATLVKGTNLDATPTNGSDNPVTSDGVYDAIAAIPAGADGKSAYQSYLDTTSDSPVKTEAEWVASLLPTVVSNGDMAIVEGDDYIDIFIYEAEIATTPTIIALDGEAEAHKSATLNVVGSHLKADIVVSVPTGFYIGSTGTSTSDTLTATGGSVNTSVVIRHSGNNPNTDITGVAITLTSGSLTKTIPLSYTRYAGPTILADSTLTIKAAAGQSNTGSLQVTGLNLTAGINASVSGTGFTVSNTENGTYGSSASLPSSGGTLYVKFSPTGSSASTGTLTLASTGATSKTVDLTGVVAGTLSISPASASIGIVSDGSGTAQFTVTGSNLTPASTASVAVSGTGMSADKQTLTVGQGGTINEVVTVTFSGSADSNGTLTVSHADVDNNATASIAGSIVTPLPTGATWIDGKLKYKVLTDQTKVSVSQVDSSTTTGAITIPSTVSDSGKTATLSDSSTQEGTGCTYTVTEIASSGFNANNNITSLTLPNTITTIGTNGIRNMGNNSMTSLVIPDSVTTIGNNNIFEIKKLTSLTIGSGVTTIGDYFLGKCSSLSQITIPNSVTSIGTYLGYAGNTYTLVDLGTGLSSISANSQFKMSDSGKVIIRFPGNDTRTLLNYNGVIFATSSGGYPCNATLYVPDALVDSYKTGYGWGVNNGGGWHMFDENNIKGLSELTE